MGLASGQGFLAQLYPGDWTQGQETLNGVAVPSRIPLAKEHQERKWVDTILLVKGTSRVRSRLDLIVVNRGKEGGRETDTYGHDLCSRHSQSPP